MPSQQSLAYVDALDALYRESVSALRGALSRYIASGERPDPAARAAALSAIPKSASATTARRRPLRRAVPSGGSTSRAIMPSA